MNQRDSQLSERERRQLLHAVDPIDGSVGVDAPGVATAKATKEPVQWISPFQQQVHQADTQTGPETAQSGFDQSLKSSPTPQTDRPHDNHRDDPAKASIESVPPSQTGLEAPGVPTEWGGVLFLINLFDYLDLMQCFEPTWGLEQRLGPWALLELVGRALLEAAPSTDALWGELARLDGREPDEPPGGPERDRQPDYLIPIEWAKDGRVESDLLWRVTDGRLRIWYQDKYVIFDGTAAGKRPLGQIADQLHRLNLPSTALREGLSHSFPQPGLAHWRTRRLATDLLRWLSLVMPYLSHRLRLAAGDGASDIEALLRCPGRLYIDRTHVDLVAGLDAINLRVRRAGLDRDPGWQPRYGRVVAFHFE
jgi:hypothetical protein